MNEKRSTPAGAPHAGDDQPDLAHLREQLLAAQEAADALDLPMVSYLLEMALAELNSIDAVSRET